MEAAESDYRRAALLADELGMRPLAAHCHLDLGKVYLRTGQRQAVHEHLTQPTTTMFREMDMRFWLERVEAETKELHIDPRGSAGADEAVAELTPPSRSSPVPRLVDVATTTYLAVDID